MSKKLTEAQERARTAEARLEQTNHRCAELERAVADARQQLQVLERPDRSDMEAEKMVHALNQANAQIQQLVTERDALRVVAAAAGDVAISAQFRNVDAHKLNGTGNIQMWNVLQNRLRQCIADDAVGVAAAQVKVEMEICPQGKLQVFAGVDPPVGVPVRDLTLRFKNSPTLARSLVVAVDGAPGIGHAVQGPISVHNLQVKQRFEDHRVKSQHLHGELSSLQRAHDQIKNAHTDLQQEHDETKMTRAALEEEVQSLRAELEEERTQHQLSRDSFESRRKSLEDQIEVHGNHRQNIEEKYNDVTYLKEQMGQMVEEWKEIVDELQDKYVNTTRDYQKLAMWVRKMSKERVEEIHECNQMASDQHALLHNFRESIDHARRNHYNNIDDRDQWRAEAQKLEAKNNVLHEENRKKAKHVQEGNMDLEKIRASHRERDAAEKMREEEKRRKRKEQFEKLYMPKGFDRHYAKLLSECMRPRSVKKLQKIGVGKEAKVANRMVKIDFVPDPKNMDAHSVAYLRWAEPKGKVADLKFEDDHQCDLSRVLCICFGHHSRPFRLVPNEAGCLAERCFSVFTPNRSFDFICESDEDCEMLVMVISRLACLEQGYQIEGSILSRSQYLAKKGWCKVLMSCKRKNLTVNQAVRRILEDHRDAADGDLQDTGRGVAGLLRQQRSPGFPGGDFRVD